MNVLLIDDSEVALTFMTRILAARGHHVISLPSPIGATSAVLRNKIDVVVIDVNLPALRGDRFASLFHANERLMKVGVVLVSGMARDELARLENEKGVDAVVSKEDVERRLHDVICAVRLKRAS